MSNQKNIYIHYNFNYNQLKSVSLERANYNGVSGTRPTPGTQDKGLVYYDTELKSVLVWDGSTWRILRNLDDPNYNITDNVYDEYIWVDSQDIPSDPEGGSIVKSVAGITTTHIPNSYSFDLGNDKVVPARYGASYSVSLVSSVPPMSPIPSNLYTVENNVVTFHDGFTDQYNELNPPLADYYRYDGRTGIRSLVGEGLTYSQGFISLSSDLAGNGLTYSNGVLSAVPPVTFFSKSYAEMIVLMAGSELVTGALYEINDFQTIHRITLTTSINTGAVEPLIVKAVSTNKVDMVAFSPLFPNDIIHYDITNSLCEDNLTPRPGKITYRMDTKWKVSTHYDFRNVKFRRWALNTSIYNLWNSGTTYNANQVVLDASNNLWISNSDANLNNTPSLTTNSYWTLLWADVTGPKKYFLSSGSDMSFGLYNLVPNPSDFKDYYTFHNIDTDSFYNFSLVNLNHIEIGPSLEPTATAIGNTFGYNNIVFLMNTTVYVQYVVFKMGNVNSTIFVDTTNNFFYSNTFEPYTNLNYFMGGGYYLLFKPTTIQNIFGLNFNSSGGIFVRCALTGSGLIGIQAYNSNIQDVRILNGATNNAFNSSVVRMVIGVNNARNLINRVTDVRLLGVGGHISTRIGPFETGNSTTSGNYRLITASINGGADILTVRIPFTFNGAVGSGSIGSLTIDRITIPSGYAVDTVTFRGTSLVYDAGASLNIGFTGNATAALDSTSGLITSANDFFKVRPTTASSTSNTALITGSVVGGSITSGTGILNITFIRI